MRPSLLRDLFDLFLAEAFEADDLGDHAEAERLCDIAEKISARLAESARKECAKEI
jgi:hypothetical protein